MGTMKIDWLTIRYFSERELDDLVIAFTNGTCYAAGKKITDAHTQERIGQIAITHGAVQLTLTGKFWQRPAPLYGVAPAHKDLIELQQHLIKLLEPSHISIPRIDYVIEFGLQGRNFKQAVDDYANTLLANWLTPAGKQELMTPTGYTVYVGSLGHDADNMRKQPALIRCYHRFNTDVVRLEVEQKHLKGENANEQIALAQASAVALLHPYSSWNEERQPAPIESGELPSRRRVTNRELAARLIGSIYNRVHEENGGVLPTEAITVACSICHLLGVPNSLAYNKLLPDAESPGA